MPAICLSVACLAALMLVVWMVRGGSEVGSIRGSRLNKVDVAAFRNLLSREDDDFLRASLSAKHYRRVRRARLRAAQEYLTHIAGDCATLLHLLRDDAPQSTAETDRSTERLAANALRLRVISLGFWLLLWIEYLLPDLQIRHGATLKRYEEFARFADIHLTARPSQPTSVLG